LIIEWMVINLNESQIRTVDQVRAVLDGTHCLEFAAGDDAHARYAASSQ